MGRILQGEDLIEARELLREIFGSIRLHPDADHLVAKFERSEIPILEFDNGRWIGSGGLSCNSSAPDFVDISLR